MTNQQSAAPIASHEQWAVAVNAHRHDIASFLMRNMRIDQEYAADVIQDVIHLILAERLSPREGLPITVSRAVSFAKSAARNGCRNAMRKLSKTVSVGMDFENYIADALSPDAEVERNEAIATVEDIMCILTLRQRQVVELHWLRDLTVREVADHLHITTKTVENTLTAAKKRLHHALTEPVNAPETPRDRYY